MRPPRSLFLILSILLVIIFVGVCLAMPLPAVPSTPSPTPTATFTPEPAATVIPSAPSSAADACKVGPYAFTNVGLGLPKRPERLPSLGTVKTIVLFADFPDVPASQTPEDLFALVSPNAERFYEEESYGRMHWVLEPHLAWLRLNQPSGYYGEAIRTYEGHLAFIQEAVTLADAEVDFSTADSVVVLVPPQASQVVYGPAFAANAGEGYRADGKTFSNGATSGADLADWGFLWLNHETGHSMGLPDLYAYEPVTGDYYDVHRYVGDFSVMGLISGLAPGFFAFERWQLGWLDDAQMICQQGGEALSTLSAIEIPGGTKAVMVPVGRGRLVVVESRRGLGHDRGLVKPGALVYLVDTTIPSGSGPIQVVPVLDGDPGRLYSPLLQGESVTVENVTVTVTEATDTTDTVHVSVMQ